MSTTIGIHGLRVPVHVGWGTTERMELQIVRFDVALRLPAGGRAGETDDLADTVDYASLCDAIREVCRNSEYRLLERLAATARGALAPLLPDGTRLRLQVTKERPPIDDLSGGASVTLDDDA
jgi:7,8-dihydroneopterin aldolase/epimerase/oxygenase